MCRNHTYVSTHMCFGNNNFDTYVCVETTHMCRHICVSGITISTHMYVSKSHICVDTYECAGEQRKQFVYDILAVKSDAMRLTAKTLKTIGFHSVFATCRRRGGPGKPQNSNGSRYFLKNLVKQKGNEAKGHGFRGEKVTVSGPLRLSYQGFA